MTLSVGILIIMWKWVRSLFTTPDLAQFDESLTRERLIQSARIVVVDDEHSLLTDELRAAGFSVDEDRSGDDLRKIDQQLYDLAIVDYHGVGARLGSGQGLDLLKHIRRVSPRTRVLAYTSRSLSASESEFFRLSHGVLPKDLGLVDSMAAIEAELRNAFGKQHLFDALVAKLAIADADKQARVREALVKALNSKNPVRFKEEIVKIGGTAADKAVELIVGRLFGGAA